MRVLVCPDKFAGTLTASQAATAIAAGWQDAVPTDEVLSRPLSDGGPGFLAVLHQAMGGRLVGVATTDPLGRTVPGQILLAGEPTRAYLESATACGLHLLAPDERDPTVTTSYGLGQLLAAAVESGVPEVVVGLGGTATNDAGAGMLAALGAAPVDRAGYPLPYGGAALLGCAGLSGAPRLRQVRLVAAADVDNPLLGPRGASAGYAPQKGASADQVPILESALTRFSAALAGLPGCPPGLADLPGSGAAGGIGAALLACGATVVSGIDLVMQQVGMDHALDGCHLVITGEGRFDEQSLHGKVVAGVARAAQARGVSCLVLAGQVRVDPALATRIGVTAAYGLSGDPSHTDPAGALRRLAGDLARRGLPGPAM